VVVALGYDSASKTQEKNGPTDVNHPLFFRRTLGLIVRINLLILHKGNTYAAASLAFGRANLPGERDPLLAFARCSGRSFNLITRGVASSMPGRHSTPQLRGAAVQLFIFSAISIPIG
jgi:hypothetical protein